MAKNRVKVRWSRLADLDFLSAVAWLNSRNPNGARRLAEEILDAIERLERHRSGRWPGRSATSTRVEEALGWR